MVSALSAELVDALAEAVAPAIPTLIAAIPAEVAADLGRLGRVQSSDDLDASVPGALAWLERHCPCPDSDTGWTRAYQPTSTEPSCIEQLVEVLAQPLAELVLTPPPVLAAHPQFAPSEEDGFRLISWGDTGGLTGPVGKLVAYEPGITDLVLAACAALIEHPMLVPLLAAPADTEPELAAEHGATHLALTLATGTAVLRTLDSPWVPPGPPLLLGVGLGAAIVLLRARDMPAGYPAALLARHRERWTQQHRYSNLSTAVSDHHFVLAEATPDALPTEFAANGLVEVIDGGAVIRTGMAEGSVSVTLWAQDQPPDEVDLAVHDEVVDVSWTARTGYARILGEIPLNQPSMARAATPPSPGDYRLRVHASGRDTNESEHYRLIVWPAPLAPPIVHKHADRLGHRLRGEPEPPITARPEAPYDWAEELEAATFTVVSGGWTAEEVLTAFGADSTRPLTAEQLQEQDIYGGTVRVRAVDDVVIAYEDNGWEGSRPEVLRPLSARGRAGSYFRNVNALTALSLVEADRVVAAFEPLLDSPPTDAGVEPIFRDLDLDDYRHLSAKSLLAVERFVGRGFSVDDFHSLANGAAYLIVPKLDDLRTFQRVPGGYARYVGDEGPLGADSDLLATLPDGELRELAWSVATEVLNQLGVDHDPTIAECLASRSFTERADRLARTGRMSDGGPAEGRTWPAVREPTNSDPLSAVIGALEQAKLALGEHARPLLERVRIAARARRTPVAELPAELIEEVASAIVESLAALAAAFPAEPAAQLGRSGVEWAELPLDQPRRGLDRNVPYPVLAAVRALDDLCGPLFAGLDAPSTSAVELVHRLDHDHPGVTDQIAAAVTALAAHPLVAPMLLIGSGNETELAAAHGAAHLALAVATSEALLPRLTTNSDAALGVALGAAALLLHELPPPPGYRGALLAKHRAEWDQLPRATSANISPGDEHLVLAERPIEESLADFSRNGLVDVVDGGLVIRAARAEQRDVGLVSTDHEPEWQSEAHYWDEIVEVSWTASIGYACLLGENSHPYPSQPRAATPPWPGTYRVRVFARGRDDGPGFPSYKVAVWPAPPAPEVVHKQSDRLGFRLRGRPAQRYRWLDRQQLGDRGGTITVVAGGTLDEAIPAFDVDPWSVPNQTLVAGTADALLVSTPPSYPQRPGDDALIIVQQGGARATDPEVLAALSRGARVASLSFSAAGPATLALARGGELLARGEPGQAVAEPGLLDGLEFHPDHPDYLANAMVALDRFTGRGVLAEDWRLLRTRGCGYRFLPPLPALGPITVDPGRAWLPERISALSEHADVLAALPVDRLRELAWWAITDAADPLGLAHHDTYAEVTSERRLTEKHQQRLRERLIHDLEPTDLLSIAWQATNPDPLGAAVGTVDRVYRAYQNGPGWTMYPDGTITVSPAADQFLDRVTSKLNELTGDAEESSY